MKHQASGIIRESTSPYASQAFLVLKEGKKDRMIMDYRLLIVHYATSAMKRFLTSVSLQHESKASDVITLVKKTFFARVSSEILYHEV